MSVLGTLERKPKLPPNELLPSCSRCRKGMLKRLGGNSAAESRLLGSETPTTTQFAASAGVPCQDANACTH